MHAPGSPEGPADAGVLLFGLNERPPLPKATLAAAAHLLAVVASIATAPLLIARGLGLAPELTSYVIASALIVSGLATFVQVYRIGPLGSGLLAIQGTSFSFIGAMIYAGTLLRDGGASDADVVGMLLGSAAAGALCTVVAGWYVERLRRWITVNVTGTAIFLLGLTLVGTAFNNLMGTVEAARTTGGSVTLVWLQALLVIGVIGVCATRSNPWLRLAAIPLGLAAGLTFAGAYGGLAPAQFPDAALVTLRWLPFPLSFDLGVFLILLPVFLVTMTEAIGDLTANSALSRQPVSGPAYWQRIRGGVMADGCNSVLAALAGTFPNTTFSQNNGVIRLTGVASRYVGYMVAALLVLLGSLPLVGALFQRLPGGVLHGATGLLFAMIALAGLRIVRTQSHPARGMKILSISTLIALSLTFVPAFAESAGAPIPAYGAMLLQFPVATGALVAVLWEATTS